MKRVFIPNRGEIALRIVRACRELGLECVVGCSDVDRGGLAARSADQAVVIGPAPASESYLRDDVVVQAALGTGCDAIHPGYGFLSESPRLAARAREHGITFVGPPPEVLELCGDKLRAREEAQRAGVPVLGDAGFPVLIKAVSGGGGRGIRLAHDEAELRSQLALARSEAGAGFGDDRVYLERFIPSARHVEVQIAADDRDVIHLGERDCSIQRRYQKVIEESPAPRLDAAPLRQAAVALARAIGYRNLGTVEFVVDVESEEFFFLEVNCRIQVEHPVTEAVTGLDLVAMQLQIADGGPVGTAEQPRGHAIECRLCAEGPGTVTTFAIPDTVRVDTHCYAGAVIPPYYDPLMAKLIAYRPGREEAIDSLLSVLEEVDVQGVETNRALLIGALGHPDFRAGAVTTAWLDRALVSAKRERLSEA
jgi:acetyl-CoA carboxylase biotin carboxylase subunit